MPLDKDQLVSAQVVLASASGAVFDDTTAITADNVADYAPSEDLVRRAHAVFERAGFEVSAVVGNSFSITAPVSTFEETFQTTLHTTERGGVLATDAEDADPYALPLGALPGSLAPSIIAVTFSPPPDFGPTEFFP